MAKEIIEEGQDVVYVAEDVPKDKREYYSFEDIIEGRQLEELLKWLKNERELALKEWRVRNDKLREWRNNTEAFANKGPKNTPFKNSSNVKVPLTQMITQGLYAKSKGALKARKPFWTCKARSKRNEDVEVAKITTKYLYLLAESEFDLNLDDVITDSELTKVLDGTAVHKIVWERELWNFKQREDESGVIITENSYLRNGPAIFVIPLEDFLHRKGIRNIRRAKWVSHEFTLEPWEIEERGARGTYQNVDYLFETVGPKKTSNEEVRQRNDFDSGQDGGYEGNEFYELSEIYVYEDIDGDGINEELIITAHLPSCTPFMVQVNKLGFRPFVSTRHVPRAFSYTGRGTGQLVEGPEQEATATHNLRIDNMKIANMRVVVASPNANFGRTEEIYPGKIIRSTVPREDVQSFQLGEVYPSAERAEMIAQQYAQKVTGFSDTQMGFADQVLKSRDTARGQAIRMQAGNSILEDIQEASVGSWGMIGLMVYLQLVANREIVLQNERMSRRLTEEELRMLDLALSIPIKEIPRRLKFVVETTDVEHTFEVRRQNTLTLVQLYAQWAQQSMPLVQALFGPQGQQMLQMAPKMYEHMLRVYTGSAKLMEDVFEFFGKMNTGDYIPNQDDNERMLEFITQLKEMMGNAQGMAGQGTMGQGPMVGQNVPQGPVPQGPVQQELGIEEGMVE